MRIDKFLWCVRYYKTRNMVTEACKKNHITVNNQVAKASKEVFAGDKVTFRRDQITYLITILDIPPRGILTKRYLRIFSSSTSLSAKFFPPYQLLSHPLMMPSLSAIGFIFCPINYASANCVSFLLILSTFIVMWL